MNYSNGEVNQIVSMWSDVESAFKVLLVSLGHTAYLYLVGLVHQAF